MHKTEINRVRKDIWRLTLAEHDMRLVARTAEAMEYDEHFREDQLLEAGMIVVYCRSFSGPPKEDWIRRHIVDELAPEGNLHATLFEMRSKLFAHTDEDYRNRRKAVDVFGNHSYSVEYRHLNPQLFPAIRATAFALAERFKDARHEREQTLREAGVEPELYFPDR